MSAEGPREIHSDLWTELSGVVVLVAGSEWAQTHLNQRRLGQFREEGMRRCRLRGCVVTNATARCTEPYACEPSTSRGGAGRRSVDPTGCIVHGNVRTSHVARRTQARAPWQCILHCTVYLQRLQVADVRVPVRDASP